MYSTYKFQTPLQADRLNMIIPGSATPGLCSKPIFSVVSTSSGNMNINISPFMCFICPNDLANNQSSNVQNAFIDPSQLGSDKTSATRLVKLYFNENVNVTISGPTGSNSGYITLKYNMNTDTCVFSFKSLASLADAASVDAINKVNEKEIKIATICNNCITSIGADFSHSFLNSINVKPGYDFNLITKFIDNEAKFVYGFKNNNVPFEKVTTEGNYFDIGGKYLTYLEADIINSEAGVAWDNDNQLISFAFNDITNREIQKCEFFIKAYTITITSGGTTTFTTEKNMIDIIPCEKKPNSIKIIGTTLYLG